MESTLGYRVVCLVSSACLFPAPLIALYFRHGQNLCSFSASATWISIFQILIDVGLLVVTALLDIDPVL